jgi:(+)-trans-carveol dehydrogenase
VGEGVAELGALDIVVANAGVFQGVAALDVSDSLWQDIVDINLTGVWNTCKVALPHVLAGARGGSMVLISSAAGMKGTPNTLPYTASKHGVVGVMRTLANEFGRHMIRVNSVHPGAVDTVMIQNESTWALFDPDNPHPSQEKAMPIFQLANALPVPWVESLDVSNAVLFLCSDEARYITGVTLPVDAGNLAK